MKTQLLTSLALLAVAALAPRPAAAQNMNQMIQNQVRMQQIGNQMAMAAARNYYNYALQLRRQGYTGQIPTGVTTQSLNATNQALMQQGMNNVRSNQTNSRITSDAITSTNNAITRGCASSYWNGYRWICQ
jgi:hypothetical protein